MPTTPWKQTQGAFHDLEMWPETSQAILEEFQLVIPMFQHISKYFRST